MENKTQQQLRKQKIQELIGVNPDARQYFFAKADERWLEWLWENGFLEVIKQKAEDPTQYRYQTPELNYLVKMAEKKPKQVADIILTVPISKENFNPEVIDQFSRICSALPAEQLARIVSKIRDDGWVQLMSSFDRWGFEYEKMFEILAVAKDYKSILILAEAVLSVRTKEEIKETSRGFSSDKPFYFNDLSYTKVFKNLIAVDDENMEQALELTTKVMTKIIYLGDKAESNEVFPVREIFYLSDVDFFSLEPSDKKRLSYQDDVRELAATIKVLTQRLIEKRCDELESVREIYKKYIETLPENRSMWRLRLFVLSLCPNAFQDELEQSFLRLFKVIKAGKSYYDIESGTEYKKALKKSFGMLNGNYQRKYVKNVFKYFGKSFEDKKEEQWYKRDGWQILSSICEYLTEEEHKDCEKIFGKKCDSTFEPEPSVGKIRGGWVKPRGPITHEEFNKLPIAEIAKRLRSEWTPEALRKQNTSDDFLNPLNAEGAGELLRADIAKRLQEYVQNANLFFERGVLDEYYTYSFFQGVQEAIRVDRSKAASIQWDRLIELFIIIKKSGEAEVFNYKARERGILNAWLSSWTGVHSAITDVIQELLNEQDGKIIIDFTRYRSKLFGIIRYLLAYTDPTPEDEKLETASMKTKSPSDENYLVSDPFSMAINTVRGRAFQAFLLFVYQDGKKFSKEESPKISSDVKELYETVLKNEKTRALMFMFGYYLPLFYLRDKKWIKGLLVQIFPKEPEKKYLYTAAWEGYLSTNLYKELFFDPDIQKLYERGLALTEAEYPKQKHFKEPDEGIAIHIALAFIHFLEFDFEDDLFKKFWNIKNLKRHKEFISFIGRHSISREAAAERIKYNKVKIEKIKKFWDWALEHCDTDELTGFGFWIGTEGSIFDIKWLAQRVRRTLEKTKGYVEWEYGLIQSLVPFAKEAPKDTLAILRAHLLEEVAKHEPIRTWLHMDKEVFNTFKELYKNEATKEGVRALINDLLPYRNGLFWRFKSVLEEKI
ncbi:hypothetical protein ES707_07229 [subsurface metagenome]